MGSAAKTASFRVLRNLIFRMVLALLAGAGWSGVAAATGTPGTCAEDDVKPRCLAARALDAIEPLPADERASVLGTLLAVHLNQHIEPPPGLVAMARKLALAGPPGERLQVLLPLAELAFRASDKLGARRQQRQVEALLAQLAGRRHQAQNYLEIADVCIGLSEMLGGAPVLAAPWAKLYGRYCKPAFFARLRAGDAFSTIVRSHLQLVAHYLVQDRAAFSAGLPETILTLRTVIDSMQQAALPPAEREAAIVIAGAMQVSLGALACLFELDGECRAILLGAAIPDEVGEPALWSSWAAVEAVRGEGLAAGGRVVDGIGALDWLLDRAAEPEHRSHRAVFLASAAWLADRLESLRAGRRQLQVA